MIMSAHNYSSFSCVIYCAIIIFRCTATMKIVYYLLDGNNYFIFFELGHHRYVIILVIAFFLNMAMATMKHKLKSAQVLDLLMAKLATHY